VLQVPCAGGKKFICSPPTKGLEFSVATIHMRTTRRRRPTGFGGGALNVVAIFTGFPKKTVFWHILV